LKCYDYEDNQLNATLPSDLKTPPNKMY